MSLVGEIAQVPGEGPGNVVVEGDFDRETVGELGGYLLNLLHDVFYTAGSVGINEIFGGPVVVDEGGGERGADGENG